MTSTVLGNSAIATRLRVASAPMRPAEGRVSRRWTYSGGLTLDRRISELLSSCGRDTRVRGSGKQVDTIGEQAVNPVHCASIFSSLVSTHAPKDDPRRQRDGQMFLLQAVGRVVQAKGLS